jgi:hypothetical protein
MQAVERAIQVMHTYLHEVLTLEDLASVADLASLSFPSRLSSSDWHSPWRISLRAALAGGPAFACDDSAQRDRDLLRGGLKERD